jgi:5-methylcytosine-specific restriction endonuclease McrA
MSVDNIKVGSRAWNKYRISTLQEADYICYYCGAEATEVDHYIPRAKWGVDEYGQPLPGLNDPENLKAACKPCNSSKRDRYPLFLGTEATHTLHASHSLPESQNTELTISNGAASAVLGSM